MEIEFVWVVCNMDYGDNGWSIERIFLTREEAEEFVESHPYAFGYWEIEKHHVGDISGDLYGSREYDELSYPHMKLDNNSEVR